MKESQKDPETQEGRNMATLRAIYDAHNRKDIAPLLEAVSEDVVLHEYAPADLPWGGDWCGRENLIRFFETVQSHMDHEYYHCEDMLASGDTVISWGQFKTICNKRGTGAASPWMHRTVFREGRIVEIHDFHDSMGTVEALEGKALPTLYDRVPAQAD